jgi:hypothetical protein
MAIQKPADTATRAAPSRSERASRRAAGVQIASRNAPMPLPRRQASASRIAQAASVRTAMQPSAATA